MNTSYSKSTADWGVLKRLATNRGTILVVVILFALVAFELFNYTTTQYSLSNWLANSRLWGVRWATLLAVALCATDFAGIARVFTPEQGRDEPWEVYYLFGAWIVCACANAYFTYLAIKGVMIANPNPYLDAQTAKVIPILIALVLLGCRILLILSFSKYADRLAAQMRMKESKPTPNKPSYLPQRPQQGQYPQMTRPVPQYSASANKPPHVYQSVSNPDTERRK